MGRDIAAQMKAASEQLARTAWLAGDLQRAVEFLDGIEPSARAPDVEAGVCTALMKEACDEGRWGQAVRYAERAVASGVDGDFARRRLHRLRTRSQAELSDERLELMLADPAPSRLAVDSLTPQVDAVLAVGTYIAWHTPSRLTDLLRLAKRGTGEERDGATRLLGWLLARWLSEYTDYLAVADVVTAVPADADRWLDRDRRSLPDALGRAVEAHCGIPYEPDLLQRSPGNDVKMSELGWAARRRRVRDLYGPGGQAAVARSRAVVLVDDITTSGATMRECGRVLKSAGAAHVLGAVIAHTEG